MKPEDVLTKGAAELGVELSSAQVGLFLVYLDNLKFWNEKINITGIDDDVQVIVNHFLDSISVARFIPDNSRIIDIGSGGGFPGIPLAILKPNLQITLIESVRKKVFFMREVIRKLRLENADAVWGRAEDVDNGVARTHFDFVVSRAVSGIENLVRLSVPYLGEDGKIILMRGKRGIEEWSQAGKTNRSLALLNSEKLSLPFGNHERVVLVIGRLHESRLLPI